MAIVSGSVLIDQHKPELKLEMLNLKTISPVQGYTSGYARAEGWSTNLVTVEFG